MTGSILFIDPDIEFREETAKILSAGGSDVVQISRLKELREQGSSADAFDFVIAEIAILDDDGLNYVADLEDRNEEIGIIVLSHRGQDNRLLDAIKSRVGVTLFARKPLLPNELAEKILTLIRMEIKRPGSLSVHKHPFEDPNATHEEQIVALRTSYMGKIPSLLRNIGNVLVEVCRNEVDPADMLDEAFRLAHSLNITAGSLGFHEVCAVAKAMEGVLVDLKRLSQITTMPPADYAIPTGIPEELIDSYMSELEDEFSRSVVAQVLVVDDDLEFLASAVAMGRDNLIRVHPASNGEEAMDIARSQKIDAAIIDAYLTPDDDPFSIAKSIRSIEHNADLSISFISADNAVPTRIAAVHAGASQFLQKPLLSQEFAAAVRHLLPFESTDQPRIFVVDDDEDFLKHIKLILESKRMKVDTLSDPTRILQVMSDVRPDIVLLDVIMQEINGFDVCKVLRSTERWRDVPILFLTIHASDEVLLRCFESGGDDYIEKPVLKEELLARIGVRMDRVRLFKEKVDRDGLTGLATRRAFIEQLNIRIAEGRRYDVPLSLCLLDLDHFKRINDKFGHLAGDRVLAGFGRLLASRFRAMDVRGRWGGEEFVLAFYGEEAPVAKMIVGRVQEELNNMVFRGDHGEKFRITFSAGIVEYPNAGISFEEIFRAVDEKLYAAKKAGRNYIEI